MGMWGTAIGRIVIEIRYRYFNMGRHFAVKILLLLVLVFNGMGLSFQQVCAPEYGSSNAQINRSSMSIESDQFIQPCVSVCKRGQ